MNHEQTKKTIQTIGSAIRYSLDKRARTFVTIMDSAARICRQGLPEFKEFEEHRAKHPDSR